VFRNKDLRRVVEVAVEELGVVGSGVVLGWGGVGLGAGAEGGVAKARPGWLGRSS
jgi:hypothetical protein